MGLFSSKKKVVVGTSAQRVLDDDTVPDSIKSGSIRAILRSGDIHEEVLDSLTKSIGVRAERMYAYADRYYPHGLPSGEYLQATKGKEQVKAFLDSLEGEAVEVIYSNFGPPNSLHVGWMQLVSVYGYNTQTNELTVLSASKGTPVYLQDMVVVVPENQIDTLESGVLAQWGAPPTAGATPIRPRASGVVGAMRLHTPVQTSTTATEDSVRFTAVWKNTSSTWYATENPKAYLTENTEIALPQSLADNEAEYFHVKYRVRGQEKYWMYRMGAGTHASLDALFDTVAETNGEFFPFLYFRFDKQQQNEDKTTEAYKRSKRMAKYLGMDFDTVTDTIGENPDIGQVEQAMLTFAVPANSDDPLELQYLFDFFERLESSGPNQNYVPGLNAGFTYGYQPNSFTRASLVIQDKLFKMVLGYQELFKERKTGVLGTVGSYSVVRGSKNIPYTVVDAETNQTITRNRVVKFHEYRYQDTANSYASITVIGLQMLYYVEGSHKVTADENDEILLIPLDKTISSKYQMSDRERLYSRAMHFVFNSLQIIKIKWYQTGIFAAFMTLVAIALAIYDGGTTLGAVLGLQGAAAILATIVINLIIGELLKVAFKLFAKVFGEEFTMLVAIVALVTASYQVFQSGSLQGAPWAQDLLMMANGLSNAALEVGYSALMADQNSFLAYMEEQNKLLETANELLENKTALNPFVIFGESPTDYFNRTVHSGNIGVFGIEAVAQYTEIALTLPKLNDTLGDVL